MQITEVRSRSEGNPLPSAVFVQHRSPSAAAAAAAVSVCVALFNCIHEQSDGGGADILLTPPPSRAVLVLGVVALWVSVRVGCC